MIDILTNTKDMTKEEWRSKGIEGSNILFICGINKYKSVSEFWMKKRGYKENEESVYCDYTLELVMG